MSERRPCYFCGKPTALWDLRQLLSPRGIACYSCLQARDAGLEWCDVHRVWTKVRMEKTGKGRWFIVRDCGCRHEVSEVDLMAGMIHQAVGMGIEEEEEEEEA